MSSSWTSDKRRRRYHALNSLYEPVKYPNVCVLSYTVVYVVVCSEGPGNPNLFSGKWDMILLWWHFWADNKSRQPVFFYFFIIYSFLFFSSCSNFFWSPPVVRSHLFWKSQNSRYKNITAMCDEVFYKCRLPETNHEIFYQLCQLTFLETKKRRGVVVCQQHCAWCSVLFTVTQH